MTLLEVRASFGVFLAKRRALSAWAHPACCSAASRFFASRASRDRGYDSATPPVDFSPPSGFDPGLHRPSEKVRRTGSPLRGNPPGLYGPSAHEASAVFWLRGMPVPARARPAFLRLRRAGPRATSNADRVCFAPATLLSFLLQGLFPARDREIRFRVPSFLAVGVPANRDSSASKA